MYHYAKFDGKKKVFRFNNEEELRDMLAKLENQAMTINSSYRIVYPATIPICAF